MENEELPSFADQFTNGETSLQYVGLRGLTRATEEFFDIKTEIREDGTPHARLYPYPWGTPKVRLLTGDSKRFFWKGDGKTRGLFGRDKFDSGSTKSVTIVEGEEDAAAAYQMLGKYPVVSVQSSSSAKQDCIADRDWLNAFDRIYLCLDNDDPGRKAASEIASLFDYNKILFVPLSKYKDANDYLQAGDTDGFRNVWYGAKKYTPEGIVSTWAEFKEILYSAQEKPIGTWPWKQINDMALGFRPKEIVLIDAQEGVGKTEFVRAIEHHLLITTDHSIGCIHLEESKERQLWGLISYDLKTPVHKEPESYDKEELFRTFQKITKTEGRYHTYKHFGSNDPDVILDRIRFLVSSAGCKFIFLDHITQVISGLQLQDERKTLDYLMTALNMMVQELDFCLILVSHVNDDDRTRGSRLISKAPHFRLSLFRNIEAQDPHERNQTRLLVRKNRFASTTGPAGFLYFDPETFIISEIEPAQLPPLEGASF